MCPSMQSLRLERTCGLPVATSFKLVVLPYCVVYMDWTVYTQVIDMERLLYLTKMPPCLKDDVVMGTLTVRENLQFSAALRLPKTMKTHEKNERINTIIKELGLDKVADSKV